MGALSWMAPSPKRQAAPNKMVKVAATVRRSSAFPDSVAGRTAPAGLRYRTMKLDESPGHNPLSQAAAKRHGRHNQVPHSADKGDHHRASVECGVSCAPAAALR
jgi:hypothetical protein